MESRRKLPLRIAKPSQQLADSVETEPSLRQRQLRKAIEL
jgi:hypothetical protein